MDNAPELRFEGFTNTWEADYLKTAFDESIDLIHRANKRKGFEE